MVSVIIVNYHTAALAHRAVMSILDSSVDVEVFIVDNSTSDSETEMLKGLLPPEVKLIFNERNEGFARACNRAYALSKGKYILLLNPDAYLLPNALEILTNFLLHTPKAGAVGPRIYWDDEKRFILPINYIPMPIYDIVFVKRCGIPAVSYIYSLIWRRRFINAALSRSPIIQSCLSGGSVLFRRDALELAGGLFDELYFMYYEDADLFLRLIRNGYLLYLNSTAEVVHHWNQSPEFGKEKTSALEQSHSFFINKHFSRQLQYTNAVDKIIDIKDRHTESLSDIGKISDHFRLSVPSEIGDNWIFEWSHNPNLFPAVLIQGKGDEFVFPSDAIRLLKKGKYYGRLSDPGAFWVKPPSIRWEI